YLLYDPAGYELTFDVVVDNDVPLRMLPNSVDVKVTRWNGTTSTYCSASAATAHSAALTLFNRKLRNVI
ncbi:MAG: hypothetical protein IKK40_10515, partial [Bacteroidales bacterium]|nr:hypothetical protein [Bacteroidales bacterium]